MNILFYQIKKNLSTNLNYTAHSTAIIDKGLLLEKRQNLALCTYLLVQKLEIMYLGQNVFIGKNKNW